MFTSLSTLACSSSRSPRRSQPECPGSVLSFRQTKCPPPSRIQSNRKNCSIRLRPSPCLSAVPPLQRRTRCHLRSSCHAALPMVSCPLPTFCSPTRRPKPAAEGGALLPAVSRAMLPSSSAASAANSSANTPFTSPRNTLASASGVVIANTRADWTLASLVLLPPRSALSRLFVLLVLSVIRSV